MTGPEGANQDEGRFAEEICRDERFETRLAVKALICVAIVAVLIVTRLIGF
jgi:hypothetical protein